MANVFRGPLIFKTWSRDPYGVAIGSQTWVWQDPSIALLKGKDTFFRGAGDPPNYDWPNPTLPKSRQAAIESQAGVREDRLLNLLAGKDVFFYGAGRGPVYDWPNPTLPKSRQIAVLTTVEQQSDRLNNLLIGKDRLFGPPGLVPDFDWTNPIWPKSKLVALSSQDNVWQVRNPTLYVGKDSLPFSQDDWPNTVPLRSSFTAVNSQTSALQNILVGTLYATTLSYIVSPPLIFRNWSKDTTAAVRAENEAWQNGLLSTLVGQDRIYAGPGQVPTYDMPPPVRAPSRDVSITAQSNVFANVALVLALVASPFTNEDRPNPTLAPSRSASIQSQANVWQNPLPTLLPGQDKLPVLNFDWPNPVRVKDPRATVTASEDSVWQSNLLQLLRGQDVLPFNQDDWPLSIRLKQPGDAALSSENNVWSDRLVNLLIGKDQLPFVQGDWPNPGIPSSRYASVRAQEIVTYNFSTFSIIVAPFSQSDWPVVRPLSRNAALVSQDGVEQDVLLRLLQGQDALPHNQDEWPNPQRQGPRQADSKSDLLLTTLANQDQFFDGPGRAPTYDYPNPNRLKGAEGISLRSQDYVWQNLLPNASIASPFAQDSWPNPLWPLTRQPALRSQDDVFRDSVLTTLKSQDQLPALLKDWPNPTLPKSRDAALRSEAEVWQDRLLNLLIAQDKLPFSQKDWPLPFRPGPRQADSYGDILATMLAGQDVLPFSQDDWPLPIRPGPRQSESRADLLAMLLAGQDKLPFSQSDWPVPKGRLSALSSDPQNLLAALLGGVQRPFALYEWPNPQRPAFRLFSQDAVSGGLASFVIPFAQYDWPLPARSIRQAPSFNSTLPQAFYAFGTKPFAQDEWPNPRGPQRPVVYDSANIIAIFGTPKPFAIYDWPNPTRAVYRINGQESSLVAGLARTVSPFAQYDWPNPLIAISKGIALSSEERVWQDGLLNVLAGQDQFFGGPGRGPVYDYPNPNRLKEPWGPALRALADAWRNPLGHAKIIIGHSHLLGSEVLAQLVGSKTKADLLGSKTDADLKGSKTSTNLLGSKLASQLKGEIDDD